MIHIEGLENYRNDSVKHICLGVFDGFHRGHQALVEESKYMVSFYPHPKEVLNQIPMHWLTTKSEQKLYHPHRLYIPFNQIVSELIANDFLNKIIGELLTPSRITIGYDFKFGKNKQGNARTIRDWCEKYDCECVEIPKQTLPDGTPFKSSIIRECLQNDFEYALTLLGHPYLIYGTVISGEKRGRSLGFPTANLQTERNKLVPKMGVYKASVMLNQNVLNAIVSIGNKPTFQSMDQTIEVHILDGFDQNIYGQSMFVELTHFIRDHRTFSGPKALIDQIHQDINQCKAMGET